MTEIIYQQENHRDFQGYSVKFLFLNSTNCFEFEKKEFRLNDSNTEVTQCLKIPEKKVSLSANYFVLAFYLVIF